MNAPMLDREEIFRRLCKLTEEVFGTIGADHPTDCFCGEGGFWGAKGYGGTYEGGYRNDGEALRFIEAAVREKLGRAVAPPGAEPAEMELEAIQAILTGALSQVGGWPVRARYAFDRGLRIQSEPNIGGGAGVAPGSPPSGTLELLDEIEYRLREPCGPNDRIVARIAVKHLRGWLGVAG